jgi:nucleotide-binding universal stress UspA family protein
MNQTGTIGVGFVGTPESRAGLGHAIRECTTHGSDLTIVVPSKVAASEAFTADVALAEASLGGRKVTLRLVPKEDDVAQEMIDLSYEEGTTQLVMGLKRRSPVGKLILGSLTQKVLLDARCPVTAVKPPVTTSE